MAAGLQIINDSGVVQIDQDFSCFQFAQSYIVNVAASNANGTPYTFDATTYSEDLYALGESGGQPVSMGRGGFTYYGTVATQVKIYRFSRSSDNAATNFGIQVFKADGSLAFTMSKKAMVISNFYIVPDGFMNTPYSLSSSAAKTAVVYSRGKVFRWAEGNNFSTIGMSLEAVSVSGSTVVVYLVRNGRLQSGEVLDPICPYGGPLLIVDVLGL